MKHWPQTIKHFTTISFTARQWSTHGYRSNLRPAALHNLLYIRLKRIKRVKIKKNYWTGPRPVRGLFSFRLWKSFIFQSADGQDVDFINSHVCGTNSTMIYPIRPVFIGAHKSGRVRRQSSVKWAGLRLSVRFGSNALHAGLVHITSDYTVTKLLKNAKFQPKDSDYLIAEFNANFLSRTNKR